MFSELYKDFIDLKQFMQEEGSQLYERLHAIIKFMKEAECGSGEKFRDKIIRDITSALDENKLYGKVAEIGGQDNGLGKWIPDREFIYLSLYPENNSNTIVADITNCPQVKDESFDAVISVACFEHFSQPWRAAEEITRILKPGGITCHYAPFSYFYHEAPLDYWRFSPEGLRFMFRELEPLKIEFFCGNRRRNNTGASRWLTSKSHEIFAEDALGGWRENWFSIYMGRKTPGWAAEQIDKKRKQLAVDLCFAAARGGMSSKEYPQKVAFTLSHLTFDKSGQIQVTERGKGIAMEPTEVQELYKNRKQYKLRPTACGYSIAAMLGADNVLPLIA